MSQLVKSLWWNKPIITVNKYNYSKQACQNQCRFSKKVKKSTVSLNWLILLKLLNLTICHVTPDFFYISRVGLKWPKFCIIAFPISKNTSTLWLILNFLLYFSRCTSNETSSRPYIWHSESKIITALISVINISEPRGI